MNNKNGEIVIQFCDKYNSPSKCLKRGDSIVVV